MKNERMAVLETLSREHKEVLEKLAIFGTTLQKLEMVKLDLLGKSVEELEERETFRSIRRFIDFFEKDIVFHFKIEEEALFPYLKKTTRVKKAFISELNSEHEYLMKQFSEFKQLISKLDVMDIKAFEKLVKIAKDIIAKLSAHAQKEDDVLPLARLILAS